MKPTFTFFFETSAAISETARERYDGYRAKAAAALDVEIASVSAAGPRQPHKAISVTDLDHPCIDLGVPAIWRATMGVDYRGQRGTGYLSSVTNVINGQKVQCLYRSDCWAQRMANGSFEARIF
jgi:hypothetical protein